MDNNSPPDQSPTANPSAGADPSTVVPVRTGGMKVIKPTSDTLSPESPLPQTTAPPAAVPAPTTPPVAPSSIYPEATHGINAEAHQPLASTDNKKDIPESFGLLSFSSGYAAGGTIFFLQLLAAIVLGFILSAITSSFLKTTNLSTYEIVSLVYRVFELFILIYIPYNILKSGSVEDPFWVSVFGGAIQSAVFSIVFGILAFLLLFTLFAHDTFTTLLSGGNKVTTTVLLYGGFLIIAYFLTKLAYGLAFMLCGKIKNPLVIKVIGLTIIALVVGAIAQHYLTINRAYSTIENIQKTQQVRHSL